tara:strand:- start:1577 stop:2359 length:783 start_codon:yes stop_codon:yes gene_type:complete
MDKKSFEGVMYEYTEWPGDQIPYNDLHFISHRYEKVLSLSDSKDILEIGSGSSIAKKEISTVAKSYTGIDISKENILRINKECKDLNLSLYVGNAEDMLFDDNSFDLVIALAMVYYLDVDNFLSEVKRVLRPGGTLFFCTSNMDVPGFMPAPGSKKYFSVNEWRQLLNKFGFKTNIEVAFPQKSFIKLGARAKLISFMKLLFINVLGLSSLWKKTRELSKGSLIEIPNELNKFPKHQVKSSQIKDLKDKTHKIIYFTCFK